MAGRIHRQALIELADKYNDPRAEWVTLNHDNLFTELLDCPAMFRQNAVSFIDDNILTEAGKKQFALHCEEYNETYPHSIFKIHSKYKNMLAK